MMRNLVLLSLCFLVAAVAALMTDRLQPAAEIKTPLQSERPAAPDFSFADLGGRSRKLSDFRGKGVVLNFWASWCAPCVIEFPQMIRLASAHEKKTVFVFMSVDDNPADIEKFLKKFSNISLPSNVIIAHDREKLIARGLFQTYKLPETYLIDADLYITDKIIGVDDNWNSAAMNAKIKALYSSAP